MKIKSIIIVEMCTFRLPAQSLSFNLNTYFFFPFKHGHVLLCDIWLEALIEQLRHLSRPCFNF